MIKYDYEITVNGNQAKLNKDIYLFRGNKNVHYYFAVKNASFNFKGSTDLIEKTNAINAAVTVIKPNNVEVASAIAKVENGKIHLKVTEDLIDEEVEVGDFDLVFDLFDDTDGAVTIPKVIGQFHVLERPCTTPISELVATNTTNEVDQALTDYAIVTYAEPVASTNADGTFAKKTWVAKEKITTAELNRMEEGISDVSSQCKDIANLGLTKHTDGKVYIKKQDGTLLGTGVKVSNDTDLSKVTMSMSGQTLKLMNDGTQVASVEIPTAVVTDEQLTSIIQSKIDDGTLTSIALGDDSVKENNIQDGVVTPNKTNFFQEINHNLLSGKTIKKSSNNSIEVLEYIEVNTNTLYIECKRVYDGIYKSITCYDDNYSSLGTATSTVLISSTDGYCIYKSTLLENTKYVKVVFHPINITLEYVQNAYMKDTEIIHGENQITFNVIDKYKNQIYNALDIDTSVKSEIDTYVSNSVLSNITETKDKNLICELSDVLKNSSLITSGTTLDKGETISSNGYISDYIPYDKTDIYVCTGVINSNISPVTIFSYDTDMQLLDGATTTTLTGITTNKVYYKKVILPNDTAYIRVFNTDKNKVYLRSNMIIDTEQFMSLENSGYARAVKKSPFYYLDKDCVQLAKGNFITDDTDGKYIPYIINIKGYTKLYTKMFPIGYYTGTMVFVLLDDNMQVISTVNADRVLYNHLNDETSVRTTITQLTVPKNASYFMVKINPNDIKATEIYKTIFSPQYITEDENVDSTNYTYLENEELLQYVIDNSPRDIQDDCYKFSKIGKLITGDTYFRYMCWSTDLMHYDSSIDKFVHIIKTSTAHGGNADCGYIVYINPSTLEATQLAKMYINDEKTDWAKWLNGFVIDGDGNYLVWYYDYENSPRQMHRIISTDKGKTWTDNGVCSMPTETGYFQQVTRLSSGTLLGSYDDGTISVNSSDKTITKVARSTDNGLTWNDVEITSEFFSVEQHFLEIDDTIMLIGRKNAYPSTQAPACISYSKDDGLTWTKEKASKTLLMHCGDAVSFIHDDIVEVFCNSRYFNNSFKVEPFIGELNHYIASKEDALQDKFILVEKFYIPGTDSGSFHGPSLAQDNEGNVLISYSCDVPTGALPSDLNFLYSTGRGGCRPICCDGVASYNLPYSGAKIENIISELKERITALESK